MRLIKTVDRAIHAFGLVETGLAVSFVALVAILFAAPFSGSIARAISLVPTPPPTPTPETCDAFVSVDVLPDTFSFDGGAVPGGPAGTFQFTARVTNVTGGDDMQNLTSGIEILTNENTVLNFPESPAMQGDTVTLPLIGSYGDGTLSPGESMDVPWTVGLAVRAPFEFFVGVVCTR